MNDPTAMFWVAGIVGWLVALFHAGRTAVSLRKQPAWVRVISAGVSATLILLATGLITRAIRADPFLWIHWLILTGLIVTLVGQVGATANDYRATQNARIAESHARARAEIVKAQESLDHYQAAMAALAPCPTQDCIDKRAETPQVIAEIQQRLDDANAALS